MTPYKANYKEFYIKYSNKRDECASDVQNATQPKIYSITIFMGFSEGWKSGYKNRALAIKSVTGSIISIIGAKKGP